MSGTNFFLADCIFARAIAQTLNRECVSTSHTIRSIDEFGERCNESFEADKPRSMNLCQVTFSEQNQPRVVANGRTCDRRTVAVSLDFRLRRESLLSSTVGDFPETVNPHDESRYILCFECSQKVNYIFICTFNWFYSFSARRIVSICSDFVALARMFHGHPYRKYRIISPWHFVRKCRQSWEVWRIWGSWKIWQTRRV